jgi:hypothetical protein
MLRPLACQCGTTYGTTPYSPTHSQITTPVSSNILLTFTTSSHFFSLLLTSEEEEEEEEEELLCYAMLHPLACALSWHNLSYSNSPYLLSTTQIKSPTHPVVCSGGGVVVLWCGEWWRVVASGGEWWRGEWWWWWWCGEWCGERLCGEYQQHSSTVTPLSNHNSLLLSTTTTLSVASVVGVVVSVGVMMSVVAWYWL